MAKNINLTRGVIYSRLDLIDVILKQSKLGVVNRTYAVGIKLNEAQKRHLLDVCNDYKRFELSRSESAVYIATNCVK